MEVCALKAVRENASKRENANKRGIENRRGSESRRGGACVSGIEMERWKTVACLVCSME